jgi:hypothetical protein
MAGAQGGDADHDEDALLEDAAASGARPRGARPPSGRRGSVDVRPAPASAEDAQPAVRMRMSLDGRAPGQPDAREALPGMPVEGARMVLGRKPEAPAPASYAEKRQPVPMDDVPMAEGLAEPAHSAPVPGAAAAAATTAALAAMCPSWPRRRSANF